MRLPLLEFDLIPICAICVNSADTLNCVSLSHIISGYLSIALLNAILLIAKRDFTVLGNERKNDIINKHKIHT